MKLTKALILALLPLLGQSTPINGLDERQLSATVTYHSTNVTNPKPTISKSGSGELAPGYLFFGSELNGANPLIMTDDGDLIWSAPTDRLGTNLHVQHYNGKKVLTVFNIFAANTQKGFIYGSLRILDNAYNIIAEVCPKFDIGTAGLNPACNGDAHEQNITPDGTLLITAYDIKKHDLSSIGGPKKGWIAESQFYELEIPSGKVLYSWKSLQHIPLNQTRLGLMGAGSYDGNPFDYFHINSVQKVGTQYLINARHTWTSYLIDSKDGSVVWSFNGVNGGSFGPLPVAPTGQDGQLFAWQHDARITDIQGEVYTLTMFNNDNYDQYDAPNPSTGFTFQLDFQNKTSSVLRDYRDVKNPEYSGQEGGLQSLPNGNVLIGYGNPPAIHEFGASDTVPLMSFKYGSGPRGGNYRAYKAQWVGTPDTTPDVAVDKDKGIGYVSWNGATQVTKWVVRSGSKTKLEHSADVAKKGFETSFKLPATGKYLQIIAHGRDHVLGESKVLKFR